MKIKGHTHGMVAFLWARKVQDEAYGANLFFIGDTIYSYGERFPIARHVGDVVLFTTHDYSTTTSKHKSVVRDAIFGTVFYVNDVGAQSERQHRSNYEDYLQRVSDVIERSKRRRKHDFRVVDLQYARDLMDEANRYLDHFLPGQTAWGDVGHVLADLRVRQAVAERMIL